nr:TonB-dependent receptor [Chromobacterium sp. ASV5]
MPPRPTICLLACLAPLAAASEPLAWPDISGREALSQARSGPRGFSEPALLLDEAEGVARYQREWFQLAGGQLAPDDWRHTIDIPLRLRSKQAEPDHRSRIGAEAGRNRQRLHADLGGGWGDSRAWRLNLLRGNEDLGRAPRDNRLQGVAPALAWGLGGDREWRASFLQLTRRGASDYGMPFDPASGQPLASGYDRYYGLSDVDREDSRSRHGQLSLKQRARNGDSWFSRLSYNDYRYFSNPTEPFLQSPSLAGRKLKQRVSRERGLELSQRIDHRWRAAGVEHRSRWTLLLRRESGQSRRDTAAGGALPPDTPSAQPDPNIPYRPELTPLDRRAMRGSLARLEWQDEIEPAPGWRFQLGARLERLRGDFRYLGYDRASGAISDGFDQSRSWAARSWRGALHWQGSPNWQAALRAGRVVDSSSRLYLYDTPERALPLESASFQELGLGWRNQRMALQGALYRMTRRHERNAGAAVRGVTLLSQRRHDRGAELNLRWAAHPRLDLAAYANWLHSRIAVAGDVAGSAGKRPRNTPDRQGRLSLRWRARPALSARLDLNWIGQRYNNERNAYRLPAYRLLGGRVDYARGDWRLALGLNNALDTLYYDGRYRDSAAVGPRRNLMFSVDYLI